MSFDDTLDQLINRHKELSDQLASPEVASSGDFGKLSKELSDLTPVVETAMSLKQVKQELEEFIFQSQAKRFTTKEEGSRALKEWALRQIIVMLTMAMNSGFQVQKKTETIVSMADNSESQLTKT